MTDPATIPDPLAQQIAVEAMIVLSDPYATREQYRAALLRIFEIATRTATTGM